MTEEHPTKRPLMVGISLAILVLMARLLYLVDSSLKNGEGMGLSGEGAIETIPILVLLALLIWIVTRSEDDDPTHPKDGDKQVIGIMVGMFLVGLYIGPDLNISLDSDMFGLAFLVIPAILIAAILLPDNSDSLVSEQEEE